MKILVTGNCGFIGQNFVRLYKDEHEIVGIDNLSYAHDSKAKLLCKTYEENIININNINDLPTDFDIVFHFGAESHVDNSIKSPSPFIYSNINGTFQILEFVKKYKIDLIMISTDEVYGDLEKDDPPFSNYYQMKPSSPYSASKASADMLVQSYHRTYGINTKIIRSCNNYGPYQYKEKFIPVIILNALNNSKIPLYGSGENIREWIFVEDNCRAIMEIAQNGKNGEIYNVGSGCEITNKEMIYKILKIMKKPNSLIEHVEDRKGHDKRYALNSDKTYKLGWTPKENLETGLRKTIQWYEKNQNYWEI